MENMSLDIFLRKQRFLNYKFNSEIKEINSLQGSIVVDNSWPGKENNSDYQLGNNWYTDKSGEEFYDGVLTRCQND